MGCYVPLCPAASGSFSELRMLLLFSSKLFEIEFLNFCEKSENGISVREIDSEPRTNMEKWWEISRVKHELLRSIRKRCQTSMREVEKKI